MHKNNYAKRTGKEGGVTTAPGLKRTNIMKDALRSLRNDVPVEVLSSSGVDFLDAVEIVRGLAVGASREMRAPERGRSEGEIAKMNTLC